MDSAASKVAARFAADTLHTKSDLDKITSSAEKKADEMEQGAKEIRKALKDFLRIHSKSNRSESKDGAAWDAAVEVFKKHKLPAPVSSLLTWEK